MAGAFIDVLLQPYVELEEKEVTPDLGLRQRR